MAKKPVLGARVAAAKVPNPGAIPPPKFLTFSFKYFREIDYFGFGQQDSGWFRSLLGRLSELSKETKAGLNTSPEKQRAWRYHPINWNQPNIPIRRTDLSWLGKDIIENEEEFPLYQFQITMALGRIVGFFDSDSVFNIVLLDPLHNIQPSSKFDYRVRETVITATVAARLMVFVEDRLNDCAVPECACRAKFAEFQQAAIKNSEGHSLIVGLEKDVFERVISCINQGYAKSISELIDVGLASLEG